MLDLLWSYFREAKARSLSNNDVRRGVFSYVPIQDSVSSNVWSNLVAWPFPCSAGFTSYPHEMKDDSL